MNVPTTDDVVHISIMPEPVARNARITQCYYDLSLAMAQRTGRSANWCTFATWASRQAGQTIRKEDMRRKLQEILGADRQMLEIVTWIRWFAHEAGIKIPEHEIRATTIAQMIERVVEKSSAAVAHGNKKVFEEIGWHFARFLETCINDEVYSEERIRSFCMQLRDGDPPDGQAYLRRAFTCYYQSLFEQDGKRRAELQFLANVEIGYHEQTRLQPQILEALNAATIDPKMVLKAVSALLSKRAGFWRGLWVSMELLVSKSGVLKNKVAAMSDNASRLMRQVITRELMTLTLPPGRCLHLAEDLDSAYPEFLAQLQYPELRQFLSLVDPTTDSLAESGAVDWGDLRERLHYIADLFRCYHSSDVLFSHITHEQAIHHA